MKFYLNVEVCGKCGRSKFIEYVCKCAHLNLVKSK